MKRIIFLFLVLFSFASCKDNLVGTWERQGDILQGMRVKINKTETSMYGEITQKSTQDGPFSLNETKWKNIKKVGANEYEFEDLNKGYSGHEYAQAHLKIDGDLLTIDMFVNNGSNTNHQLWMRIK